MSLPVRDAPARRLLNDGTVKRQQNLDAAVNFYSIWHQIAKDSVSHPAYAGIAIHIAVRNHVPYRGQEEIHDIALNAGDGAGVRLVVHLKLNANAHESFSNGAHFIRWLKAISRSCAHCIEADKRRNRRLQAMNALRSQLLQRAMRLVENLCLDFAGHPP